MESVTLLECGPHGRRGGPRARRPAGHVVARSGEPPVTRPTDADVEVPVTDTLSLALRGRSLPAADRRVLGAFAAYAAAALEQQRLAAEAEAAQPIAEADRMRTALLAAVSHDLRTPLASAKAAVTSLRSHDIAAGTQDDTDELLATADESLDRLTHLVDNLLDMCQAAGGGAVGVPAAGRARRDRRPVARRPRARRPRSRWTSRTPLPEVRVDPAILERVIVNLTENALRYSPAGTPPLLAASSRSATGSSCAWSTAGPASPRPTTTGCSCRSSGSATRTTPPASASGWPCPAASPRPWAARSTRRTPPAAD